MSALEAVLALAQLVKKLADDASHNVEVCQSLSHRVDLIPRLLEGFPDQSLLDETLILRLFQQLQKAHSLILKYKDMGRVSRALRASMMKDDFIKVEEEIGKCIRDLSLAVGIFSASKISSVHASVCSPTTASLEENIVAIEEDLSMMDMSDFADMCETAETLEKSVTIFQSMISSNSFPVVSEPTCSLAVVGNKVIVVNVPLAMDLDEKAIAARAAYYEECEEEEMDLTAAVKGGRTKELIGQGDSQDQGFVIFHIDNTTSMKNHGRMTLTKKVLLDVIPDFLRKGFRVIMNAWASDPETKGRIQTREVEVPPDLLAGDDSAAIKKYIEDNMFPILNPNGKTDIYGSFFQLLRQCRELCRAYHHGENGSLKPALLFVLTDGSHNHLDYPLHAPKAPGEDYFGVYAANKNNGTKFGRTDAGFSISACEQCLHREMASLIADVESLETGEAKALVATTETKKGSFQISCTIIGIGEADTDALSSLASALGDKAAFYGITKVEQIEEVFGNINMSDSQNQLKLIVTETGDEQMKINFHYCVEEGEDARSGRRTISGCLTLEDPNIAHRIHHSASLQLQTATGQMINLTQRSGASFAISLKLDPLSLMAPPSSKALSTGSSAKSVTAATDTRSINTSAEQALRLEEMRDELWNHIILLLKGIRSKPYQVTTDSFVTIFNQLVQDRRKLLDVKSMLYSRSTRRFRYSVIFAVCAIWLRELEELVGSQISSYRMNVEDEVLVSLVSSSGQMKSQHTAPSQVVLERLQHNLQNAGRTTYRINRYMRAISNIRDKSLNVAARLFLGQELQLSGSSCSPFTSCKCCPNRSLKSLAKFGTLVLNIKKLTSKGAAAVAADFSDSWVLCNSDCTDGDVELKAKSCRCDTAWSAISYLFDPSPLVALQSEKVLSEISSTLSSATLTVTFPCIAIKARFDQFTIVHAVNLFSTNDIFVQVNGCQSSLESSDFQTTEDSCVNANAVCFCCQEVQEVCHASNHVPGMTIPLIGIVKAVPDIVELSNCGDALRFNMVLPLAYTPLLFKLYLERGRAFHSAINVTGDCMALAPVSLQWGKFYHDALLMLPTDGMAPGRLSGRARVWIEESIHAVVAFSYAIDSHQLSPNKSSVLTAFHATATTESDPEGVVVIARDNIFSGLTCPLAVASIVACEALGKTGVEAWNLLARTLFSRMCEAISGHKNIRYGNATTPAVAVIGGEGVSESKEGEKVIEVNDPGRFEDSYRRLLGELQIMIRHRLQVDWIRLSLSEKIDVVKEVGCRDVLLLLKQIIDRYLSQFGLFNLPTWSAVVALLQRSLCLSEYGIGNLKNDFINFEDLSTVFESVLTTSCILPGSALPVFYVKSPGTIAVREIQSVDYECIVGYIDAIVATKVSPKIVFKPVNNPTHPQVDNSSDLKISSLRVDLDMSLPILGIGFIGNVNSGKSSILGRLLLDLGMVDERSLARLAAEADRVGLSNTTRYAWVLDKTVAERSRGVTIDSSWLMFQSCHRRFSIVDNPGHADFAKSCVNGIFQSDVAVLVTSADLSEIALSEVTRSQAEEQLMVSFCFGIRHIIVAVNKMDAVGYSQDAFKAVCEHTSLHLKRAGFKQEQITFVPVSALQGVNLSDSAQIDAMGWYKDGSLLEVLDNISLPKRTLDKPLRIPVDKVLTVKGIGNVLCGRVECGSISVGDKITIEPCGIQNLTVMSLEIFEHSVPSASSGENIGINVKLKKEEKDKLHRMRRGMIIEKVRQVPMSVMKRFEAQLFVVRGSPIKVGYKPAITTHLDIFNVAVVRLIEIIGKNNRVLTENPSEVIPSQTCVLELEADRAFAGDTIHENARLSRFLIKENRIVVALGFIRRKIY